MMQRFNSPQLIILGVAAVAVLALVAGVGTGLIPTGFRDQAESCVGFGCVYGIGGTDPTPTATPTQTTTSTSGSTTSAPTALLYDRGGTQWMTIGQNVANLSSIRP